MSFDSFVAMYNMHINSSSVVELAFIVFPDVKFWKPLPHHKYPVHRFLALSNPRVIEAVDSPDECLEDSDPALHMRTQEQRNLEQRIVTENENMYCI